MGRDSSSVCLRSRRCERQKPQPYGEDWYTPAAEQALQMSDVVSRHKVICYRRGVSQSQNRVLTCTLEDTDAPGETASRACRDRSKRRRKCSGRHGRNAALPARNVFAQASSRRRGDSSPPSLPIRVCAVTRFASARGPLARPRLRRRTPGRELWSALVAGACRGHRCVRNRSAVAAACARGSLTHTAVLAPPWLRGADPAVWAEAQELSQGAGRHGPVRRAHGPGSAQSQACFAWARRAACARRSRLCHARAAAGNAQPAKLSWHR